MLLGDQLNLTKSQNWISTGETAGDNADNLWCPIMDFCWNLIQLDVTKLYLEVNLWVAEKTNKLTATTQKSAALSMMPIQSPVVPIKPDGDLEPHQVRTWTQKCTRWNWTTRRSAPEVGEHLGYLVHSVYITSDLIANYYLIYVTDNIGNIFPIILKAWCSHFNILMSLCFLVINQTQLNPKILLLLSDQLNSTKSQNPISTG